MKSLVRLWRSPRWWSFVLACIVGFALLGYAIGPPPDRDPTLRYTATSTLVLTDPSDRDLNADRMELEMTRGAVPAAAAVVAGVDGIPELLRLVDIDANAQLGTIELVATAGTEARARTLVHSIALPYLELKLEEEIDDRALELELIRIDKTTLERQLAIIDAEIEAASAVPILEDGTTGDRGQASSVAVARRQALVSNYGELLRTEAALQREPTPPVVAAGETTIVESSVGGLQTPLTPTIMAIIGGLLGAGVGLGIVALSYRLNDRIDTRDEAEAAYGAAVLADVSRVPRRLRKKTDVITFDIPDAPSSAAYRHLRTMMAATARDAGTSGSTVYLVTSAHSGEGKSTTAANLAAAFSDSGNDVIIISGDLRRPHIHTLLDVDESATGILELPGDADVETIEQSLARTTLPRVRLLAHGAPVNNPGELLASRRQIIERCRELVDVVIIDAPPVLIGNDVAELLPAVDHVVVTARAHVSKTAQARAARRLLRSLGARVAGVALIESNDKTRRSYRYKARTKTSRGAFVSSRLRRGSTQTPGDSYPTANGSGPFATNGVHEEPVEPVAQPEPATNGHPVAKDPDHDRVDTEIADLLAEHSNDAWSRQRTR